MQVTLFADSAAKGVCLSDAIGFAELNVAKDQLSAPFEALCNDLPTDEYAL